LVGIFFAAHLTSCGTLLVKWKGIDPTFKIKTMKKLLLLFTVSCISLIIQAQTQGLPYIGTPTIIPQSPTPNDVVKIVTHVYTPNQGIAIDPPTFSVTQNPKEINIRGCYWQGMLTAIQDYVDTFVVGQLQSGTYTIKHKAFLSSTQQHCSKIDSNMVVTTFTVATLTGLKKEHIEEAAGVFPNPAKDMLCISGSRKYTAAAIYSADGRMIRAIELNKARTVGVSDLQPGIYFIRLATEDKTVAYKFIKE